jgi:hypothetical protein
MIIEGVKRGVANILSAKATAEKGWFMQNGTGTVPAGDYYGFELGEDGATITSIDFGNYSSLYGFATGTDISDYPFIPGVAYFMKFESIVISAGNIICYKA